MIEVPFNKPDPNQPIAVTMGDPAGVGLQTTVLAWQHRAQLGLPPFVLYADPGALKAHIAQLDVAIPVSEIHSPGEARQVFQNAVPVIPVALEADLTLGTSNKAHAGTTLQSIELAVRSTLAGETSAVVTNPITKATLTAAGFPHPGHTEFLGALATRYAPNANLTEPVMMLVADELRVVPLTIHMPLCKVAATVTTDTVVAAIKTIVRALEMDFAIANPRIAIAGLNPHAGENATLGVEDRDQILPAVVRCQDLGMNVVGPLPADTMFHQQARTTYDAALCMYHDQALIPVKTLAFDRGVNITLGLPFIRTSPDHGTALDIVGSRDVSAVSFIESVKAARTLVQNRSAFLEKQSQVPTTPSEPA